MTALDPDTDHLSGKEAIRILRGAGLTDLQIRCILANSLGATIKEISDSRGTCRASTKEVIQRGKTKLRRHLVDLAYFGWGEVYRDEVSRHAARPKRQSLHFDVAMVNVGKGSS